MTPLALAASGRVLEDRARDLGASLAVGEALAAVTDLAHELAPRARELGEDTWPYLSALARLGAGDLTVARVVEPHLDAVAILTQAARLPRDARSTELPTGDEGVWGVYAAHGPHHHLEAMRTAQGWRLTGSKPWCSLAAEIDFAVITAHTGAHSRRAFAIDLRSPGVAVPDEPWVSRGLARVPSTSLHLAAVPAVPLGPDGWYLDRPGFAWGGIGVAAVWTGAARALTVRLREGARVRAADPITLAHLGRADRAVFASELALRAAAVDIDAGRARGSAGELLAARVRNLAADAAETASSAAARGLGPGPLVGEEEHARRVADLGIYVRQHHGERDLARTGQLLLGPGDA